MNLAKRLSRRLHQFSTPKYVEAVAERFAPRCYGAALLLLAVGLFWGLFIAPADYQQKDAFRIIYVHVPTAILSMAIYLSMALAAVGYFVWNSKIAVYYCRTMARLGAVFTILALLTGAIWGKPMWGTFWSWGDPRLLSELILLFLYLGYMALLSAMAADGANTETADKMGAILLMVGAVNLPIIHYSVVWWNSLHQGATLLKWGAPSIATAMLLPLLVCLAGFMLFAVGYALTGVRTCVIEVRNERRLLATLL